MQLLLSPMATCKRPIITPIPAPLKHARRIIGNKSYFLLLIDIQTQGNEKKLIYADVDTYYINTSHPLKKKTQPQ